MRLLVQRLAAVVPMALLVSIIIFVLMRLAPGDPVMALYGGAERLDPEAMVALRHDLGLDQPIYVQYAAWLGRAVHLDLGRSIRTRQPVEEALRQRLPVTLELALLGMLISIVLALPVGILSAVRPNSLGDSIGTLFCLLAASMPYFFLGTLLVFVMALMLGWLPPSGYVDPMKDPVGNLRLMILPAITLGLGQAALIARMLRGELIEVLSQDYIRTAHAKGLAERRVLLGHGLKNAFLPVLTVLGVQVARSLGGAVITETVFALPGMGTLLVNAIYARDYPLVQGVVLVMVLGILLTTLAVDLLYGYVDPRIRFSR